MRKILLQKAVKDTCKYFNMKQILITPYQVAGNGRVETLNKMIFNSLSMFVNSRQTDWDKMLQPVWFAYRTLAVSNPVTQQLQQLRFLF